MRFKDTLLYIASYLPFCPGLEEPSKSSVDADAQALGSQSGKASLVDIELSVHLLVDAVLYVFKWCIIFNGRHGGHLRY